MPRPPARSGALSRGHWGLSGRVSRSILPSFIFFAASFCSVPPVGAVVDGSTGATDRQRNIFPLPIQASGTSSKPPGLVSRSVRRRGDRKAHWQEWSTTGVEALNQLAGVGPLSCRGTPTTAQAAVLDRVRRAYHDVGPPPPGMSTEGALSELLAHCPAYAANPSSVRPYVKDKMSWPSAAYRAGRFASGGRQDEAQELEAPHAAKSRGVRRLAAAVSRCEALC